MIFQKISIFTFAILQFDHARADRVSTVIDCSDKSNEDEAMCICRVASNQYLDICKRLNALNDNGDFLAEIINGEEVAPDVYPWFARSTLYGGWGGCGGSLVTPEYVLTAAHCVEGRVDSLKNNGGYQIGALCAPYGPNKADNCDQEMQSFGITEIIVHPNYSSNTLANDFALVRLDGSSSITPVTMDPGTISEGYEDMPLKQNLWPVGFGTTETGSVSSKLMHVNVNYVKQSTCNSNYNGAITDDMMCAADTNQDSCQGDSGGPLYDSDNNVLVGVVSWGYGCAQAGYPGVYSRISKVIEWIEDEICNAHSTPKPSFCGPVGPTSPPTPEPPTPAPTPCAGADFKLTVLTDNYPGETAWTLKNECTDEQQLQGGNYEDADTTYVEEECIPSGRYTFTITDSWGDGICCSYGSGSYVVLYDGDEKKRGGEFTTEESTTFGLCNTTPSSAPAPLPTFAPVPPPTLAPVPPPTLVPTPAPWETIYSDNFESSQGSFKGQNKRFNHYSTPGGQWSLRLRKTSKLVTQWISVERFSKVSLKFMMFAIGMEEEDGFLLKVKFNGDGPVWDQVGQWNSTTDFPSESWVQHNVADIVIPEGKKKLKIRFEGSSDKGNDRVYIDDFLLEGFVG